MVMVKEQVIRLVSLFPDHPQRVHPRILDHCTPFHLRWYFVAAVQHRWIDQVEVNYLIETMEAPRL
jgi:hypothetical protein